MSFIDLMANDIWSDGDINNRVQNLIRSRYTAEDELKAARLSRNPDATLSELDFVADVDAVIVASINEGRAAREDMALLHEVFAVEAAMRRLAMPVVEPVLDGEGNVTNQTEIDAETTVRTEAQATVEGASAEVTALVEQRNPPVPEEPLTEQPALVTE